MLTDGSKAPDFTLTNDGGKEVSLKDFRGKTVVLYFYPKDDTPGCTKEACDFRDNTKQFQEKNIVILGVSPDDTASHQKFKKKFDLPFTLLSDPDKKILEKYGVWKEKSMYGKKYMGVERTTFIITPQGKIAKIYPKVSVTDHIGEILKKLEIIQ